MPANDRGGLRAAFASFKKPDEDAERKLLGRPAGEEELTTSYQVATTTAAAAVASALIPRPRLQREAVRQLSFRCPVSLAGELRRKAAFNQLEQQEIIVEGIKRVLAELEAPPPGWDSDR